MNGPYQNPAAAQARQLQLEVYINDVSTQSIASFTQLADKRMAARRAELAEVGIKPPGSGNGDQLIVIEELGDVAYRYDEPSQKIYFKLGDNRRVVKNFDARGVSNDIASPRADFGGVMNYALFAASTKPADTSAFAFSGANATLDARVFGPYGIVSQSAIIGTTTTRDFSTLRLDTTWAYSDPRTLITYRAGDVISGGLAWTRPVRLGGAQIQRNFALRPDLVTLPLPSLSGSAAVPSTLDIFVNNVRTHSQEIPTGPYQITNVPVLTGTGEARVVVTDAAGRRTETSLPFYVTPKLLKEGLWDFSVDAGLPRILYGIDSSSYIERPVGSASLRGGIHDWLTVEAHAEGGLDLLNGGIGTVVSLGPAGVLSLAGSTSRFADTLGFQSYVGYDLDLSKFNIHASSLRTFGMYSDLASVTALYVPVLPVNFGTAPLGMPVAPANVIALKELDTISFGIPLPFDKSSVNIAFLHQVLQDNTVSNIINVSYSRPIFTKGSLFLTAFSDVSDRKNFGAYFGISMPLGDPGTDRGAILASSSVSSTSAGTNVNFDLVKPVQPVTGSYGWRLLDSEGRTPNRFAAASYRSSVAQFDGNVQQVGTSVGGSIQAQGAIAFLDNGIFFSNRINDAFAVVDVGAPGVDVLYENRPAGTTNAQGRLLIPGMVSYEKNKIAIDPGNLPVDAEVPTTRIVVAPADRSGVIVNFGVKSEVKAAVVILVDKAGKFIAPGSRVHLQDTTETFVVGYDGRTYVKELGATNIAVVTDAQGECRVSFPFMPKKNSQVVIGPLVCQ